MLNTNKKRCSFEQIRVLKFPSALFVNYLMSYCMQIKTQKKNEKKKERKVMSYCKQIRISKKKHIQLLPGTKKLSCFCSSIVRVFIIKLIQLLDVVIFPHCFQRSNGLINQSVMFKIHILVKK